MPMTEAETARLMRVTEALVREFDRQGVADTLIKLGFDALEMAKVAIRAAMESWCRFGGRRFG
ncbi:hypothetical protein [Bradyrhizobium brasilense]|uniref:hypothetical protein n=1 Tax=Bradyrhizobium brasilense TaxID=1419277 RepID=UPI001E492B72|nr:hypothetical protein [Bradyrhizobium brasilense]MCC8974308.1 hypothetical protein [Bradyrhizobium brasilense]